MLRILCLFLIGFVAMAFASSEGIVIGEESQCDDCPGMGEDGCCMAGLFGNDPDYGHEDDPLTCEGCPGLGLLGCCSVPNE